MEATYLCLLEKLGNSFGLLQGGLKMVLGSFPLTGRTRGHTCDRVRKAVDWPKCYGSRVDQFTNQRIQQPGLRLLTEDDQALHHECEQQPRTPYVWLAAPGQAFAFFTKYR